MISEIQRNSLPQEERQLQQSQLFAALFQLPGGGHEVQESSSIHTAVLICLKKEIYIRETIPFRKISHWLISLNFIMSG